MSELIKFPERKSLPVVEAAADLLEAMKQSPESGSFSPNKASTETERTFTQCELDAAVKAAVAGAYRRCADFITTEFGLKNATVRARYIENFNKWADEAERGIEVEK